MADDQVLYDQVDEEQFDEEDIIRYYFYYLYNTLLEYAN